MDEPATDSLSLCLNYALGFWYFDRGEILCITGSHICLIDGKALAAVGLGAKHPSLVIRALDNT